MRNLKKLVAFIVTLAMIATFAIPAFAAAPADVKGTAYEGAVTRLAALGVINGYPDGTFGPNDSITRAQAAAVVVRALGYESIAESAKGVTKFSDVTANYWGAGYINLAVSLGLIKGYGDGKFGPEDKVTFDQIVTMVVRALGQEAYAESKGGFPTGYLLQAKVIGFTDGVKGVSGTNATRGIVAQLIDNAKDKPIYEQTGFGDSTSYKPSDETFLTKLGMSLQADDKIVTKTPASAGLDANTFVAGGVTYTAVEGTVDIESLLGKKVDLWGSAVDSIVLAENVVGTSVAVKTVDDVTVADGVYSIDTTLADDTDKVYTVAAGASALENLAVKGIVATANDLKGVVSDKVQINFVVDGDSVLFANAIKFDDTAVKLGADPIENKVHKDIRLFTGFYIKYGDTAAKKVVIVKDGATVDWTALKSGDVLFVAGSGNSATIGDNYVYIKATSKTVTGTLQAVKDAVDAADKFKVDGTWYDISQYDAAGEIDTTGLLGVKVILTLDPAGKVFAVAAETAAVSSDKYGVVLASEQTPSLGDTVYKVKLLTSTGDKIVYTVANNDNTAGYIADFGNAALVDDLVSYHIGTDGNIDMIEDNSTLDGVARTFDTSRKIFNGLEVNSDVVIYSKIAGAYSKVALTDIADDVVNGTTATSYVESDGVINAMFLSDYDSSASAASYAYVTDFVATADGYTVDVMTTDGAKSFNTTDADAAHLGAFITYQLDGSNNMINVAAAGTESVGTITSVDASKIKVDTDADAAAEVTGWFSDTSLIVYDADSDGAGTEALTKADLYTDMNVKVYLDGDGNVLAVVVTAM